MANGDDTTSDHDHDFTRPGAEQRPSEQGPPETLVRGRRTIMQFSDGSMMEHHDDWTKGDDELEKRNSKMDRYH